MVCAGNELAWTNPMCKKIHEIRSFYLTQNALLFKCLGKELSEFSFEQPDIKNGKWIYHISDDPRGDAIQEMKCDEIGRKIAERDVATVLKENDLVKEMSLCMALVNNDHATSGQIGLPILLRYMMGLIRSRDQDAKAI